MNGKTAECSFCAYNFTLVTLFRSALVCIVCRCCQCHKGMVACFCVFRFDSALSAKNRYRAVCSMVRKGEQMQCVESVQRLPDYTYE